MTMRHFATLPIDRLVNEVAVDPVHVRELADSIKVSGPISPVMVRQDSYELIDGFHRVAAMQELGFLNVECIVTPCDDETFWDLRIMSASLHKAVTFSRAVDWIEECFQASSLNQRYVSAASLFQRVGISAGGVPADVRVWVESKAQKWGLAVRTIENWLYTKQKLAPDLLEAATSPEQTNASLSHYEHVARSFPNEPSMQRVVVQKIEQEDLTVRQAEEVIRAVKQAPTPEVAQTILHQPVSRTSDELTRSARIEHLVNEPKREPSPSMKRRELTGVALDVYLSLEHQIHNIGRLNDALIANLTTPQRDEFGAMLTELAGKISELQNRLGSPSQASGRVVEGQLVSGL